MHIAEIYRTGELGLSIEIFPPKTPEGDETLFQSLGRLCAYRPAFISCTYGAGGSTSRRTVELCTKIQNKYRVGATAHFTCVGSTRDELVEWLAYARDQGIRNIMALRGDPPRGEQAFRQVPGGLRYANELVALIREHQADFGIGVAGYPEKHQECADTETDLANLKRKVDAGADAVFTQLFFDNECFFRFRDRYAAVGLDVPLIPGIMPITEFARIKRITAMCGSSFPETLAARLEAVHDDLDAQFAIGVEHATRQCRELIEQGVPGIHFYALNRSQACEQIMQALGLEPSKVDCA